MRKVIIPETDRSCCITSSFFDPQWTEKIQRKSNGPAGGVLPYFTEKEIKQLLRMIIEKFPYSDFEFDTVSVGIPV